jgi:hypothetical protein
LIHVIFTVKHLPADTARREDMRTFTCLTTDGASTVPTLAFVFAADEERARALARRELMEAEHPVSVEVYENGRLLYVVQAVAHESAGPSGTESPRP